MSSTDDARVLWLLALLAGAPECGEPLGPACDARALERQGDLASSAKDHRSASVRYREAAHAVLDDMARWRALTKKRIAAAKASRELDEAKRLEQLLLSEREAQRPAKIALADARLDALARELEADGDATRSAWASALRARAFANARDANHARQLAEVVDRDGVPTFVRVIALEARAKAELAAGDALAEASAALRIDALRAAESKRPRDRYARSKLVAAACARYERGGGEGRCAQLAKELTGDYVFEDLSRAKPRRTMDRALLDRAQAQYSFAIEGCVRDAAKANVGSELFENATLRVGWSVRGDGRAFGVEIEPKRYDAFVGACARERVAWFRYPRWTDGQVHSIQIPYALEVTEKYGGSR